MGDAVARESRPGPQVALGRAPLDHRALALTTRGGEVIEELVTAQAHQALEDAGARQRLTHAQAGPRARAQLQRQHRGRPSLQGPVIAVEESPRRPDGKIVST